MSDTPRIAIDAMGGDDGVTVMTEGAARALAADPGLKFLLVGDEGAIAGALAALPALKAASEIRHAPEVIAGTDKPSQAIRRARTTSMG
ncbi:MAG TPA: phosphate acyltransferase, partial [Sphingomonas sp.]|nr:phosphate acyltransferase [Sphingomonas sp.]